MVKVKEKECGSRCGGEGGRKGERMEKGKGEIVWGRCKKKKEKNSNVVEEIVKI